MKLLVTLAALALILSLEGYAQFENLPRAPVTITVHDPNNKPVPGAEVHCVDWNCGPRFTELQPDEQAVTDTDGRVTFQNRTAGQVFARVRAGELGGWFRIQDFNSHHPKVVVKIGVGRTIRVNTHVPGALVLADGCLPAGVTDEHGQITVPNFGLGYDPGLAFTKEGYAWTVEHVAFDTPVFDLPLKPGTEIEGVVLDPEGKPVAGAKVYAGPYRMAPVSTDQNGHFRLTRCARSYDPAEHVSASAQIEGKSLSGEVRIRADKPLITGVTVTLAPTIIPTFTVQGRVVNALTGQPVKAEIVRNSSADLSCAHRAGKTNSDGRFSLDARESDGGCYFALPRDPTLYIEGGMVPLRRVQGKPVDQIIEFKAVKGCAISGRAISADGKPISAKYVEYTPLGKLQLHHPALTQKDGRFVLPHLDGVGATYTLQVTDALGRRGTATVGPLTPGEFRKNVIIRLPAQVEPSRLRGVVTDRDGKPLSSVRLAFTYEDKSESTEIMAVSDDEGKYELRVLYSGHAKVSASVSAQQSPGESNYYRSRHGKIVGADRVTLDGAKDAEMNFVVEIPSEAR
ncbi:MAG: carboxypeptidase regulatory-like domain-containing protein [Candidatus Hydrogenedentes bacterium]|nr:carboxypeptidase regulatory-like domain-containing protein [Candidatus Hydrogenedentota bacterium]